MKDSAVFEDNVRNVARALWPTAEYSGSVMLAGMERDAVFETEECIHLIECTEDPRKAKAVKDATKLTDAAKIYRSKYPEKAVKCWFVTKIEPTAEQRQACKDINQFIIACSYATFRSKLVDAASYLDIRSNHKFGSISNPIGVNSPDEIKYVSIEMYSEHDSSYHDLKYITEELCSGGRFTFLGDYGVGKSMSLREIYRTIRAKYFKSETNRFPIYINLREHQGQQSPAEIMLRHAEVIGFSGHHQLVRAWRAGYCILLIDGFDEVSSLGLQGAEINLKRVRYSSMSGIRRLIEESPSGTGIALAGRDSFFNSRSERLEATGADSFVELKLNEFNEAQVNQFFENLGVKVTMPEWLPRRPLLLGAIVGKLLDNSNDSTALSDLLNILDPSHGWDMLIDDICKREAKIEAGLSGSLIRNILERLATKARATVTGLGPISRQNISDAFKEVCGYYPAEMALTVLQRLSGLCVDTDRDDDSRRFVDADFADACRAADFAALLKNPMDKAVFERLSPARRAIGGVGMGIAIEMMKIELNDKTLAAYFHGLEKASMNCGVSIFDGVQLALREGIAIRPNIIVSEVEIERFHVSSNHEGMSNLLFQSCVFDELSIEHGSEDDSLPYFEKCDFLRVYGRFSKEDLPGEKFSGCTFQEFPESNMTNQAVAGLAINADLKVMLTVLRKLYLQAGGGRQENAFFRGLPSKLTARVPGVLELLRKHGFSVLSERSANKIWLPIRSKTNEALQIINSPNSKAHDLVKDCIALQP